MVGGSGFVPLATTTQTAGKVDLGSLNRYQDRGEPVDIFIPLQYVSSSAGHQAIVFIRTSYTIVKTGTEKENK